MKEPRPGLRPLFNKTKQPAKVTIVVAPGDALEVSDDVATQLQTATTAFGPGTPPDDFPFPLTDEEKAALNAPEPEPPAKRAPAKKAAAKKAAK